MVSSPRTGMALASGVPITVTERRVLPSSGRTASSFFSLSSTSWPRVPLRVSSKVARSVL